MVLPNSPPLIHHPPCRDRASTHPELQGWRSTFARKGLGNIEFNTRHPAWAGYDYAYKILTVWELNEHIPLHVMRDKYGFKMAPRGMVYLPTAIVWDKQRRVLDVRGKE